ncbi:MAG: polysaccharide biosynthesis tyrosine autokinase [Chloroflexota bacterium]
MELNIKEYLAPILKWWWLILLTTAVAGGTSYFASNEQEEAFRATTTLMVGNAFDSERPVTSEISMAATLASFYVDMANRNEVRRETAEALGLRQLPSRIAVRQVDDIFIDITITDSNAERAQAVANELARQLILRTPSAEEDDSFAVSLLGDFENQINQTTTQIELKQQEIALAQSAQEISQLQDELRALESTKSQLTKDYTSLLQSSGQSATNTISVLEPALLPQRPIVTSSSSMSVVLTAAGIGLVLSATAAYVLEYLDDTIKTPETISRITGFNTLAGIAEIRSDNKLITFAQPKSPISEAFRVLRTALQFAIVNDPSQKVFLVSSAVPEEGKSTTAANLAIVLAQAGNKTLLIDADLRRPSQHKVFGLSNRRGLSDLLIEISPDEDADDQPLEVLERKMQETQIQRLHLLTCGSVPPNPSELLGSKHMQRFLKVVSDEYDFILLDSPPVLSVTDATLLSARADGMIMVARAGKSRRQYVKMAAEKLRDVNANLLGYVLNALAPRSAGHRSYYYYNDPYYSVDEISDSDDSGPSANGSDEQSLTDKVKNRLAGGQTA